MPRPQYFKVNPWMIASFVLLALLLVNTVFKVNFEVKPRFGAQKTTSGGTASGSSQAVNTSKVNMAVLEKVVTPTGGVELPISWGDLGKQLIDKGVIDKEKFLQVFAQGGRSLSAEDQKLLTGSENGKVRMTPQNANFLLDLLWAFGLANKNDVLDKGEMMRNPSQVGNFASTGGWTLARGKATDYYSKFRLLNLTSDQQALVEKVSQGIYRPCCGNSTHFPDCNHGMAMLGLLELMAAQGVSEAEMYQKALAVNSYWFPQTYVELAAYFSERGTSWDKVNAKEVLGVNFSSAQGYRQTRAQIKSLPPVSQGGGGCGV